jgi:ferritin
MIKKTMQDAINEQIRKEMYSSNLYLSMAAYYYTINLNGFANWMRVQAQEEQAHALKFYDYLVERGGHAIVGQIDAPPIVWDSPLSAFEASYKHEQMVTASINALADLAIKESDHASNIMLQWFITEQVEEEANVSDIVERLKMMGDFKGGLLMMDAELKTRVFVPPPTTAKP